MPDYPAGATQVVTDNFNIHMVAVGNDPGDVSLAIETTVTGAELETLRTRIGALTNAAVQATSRSTKEQISEALAVPLDEAHSAASQKMVLVFQNSALDSRQVAIPAPDASYFGTDGISIITPNGGAAAGSPAKLLFDAIAQIVLVLNGGAVGTGDYLFLRGFRSQFARKLPKPRGAAVTPVEPSGAVEPGSEPGA